MNEESIFLEALRKDTPEEVAEFLDQACANNAELRRAILSLLEAHEKEGSFLQGLPDKFATIEQPIPESPGAIVGPYKLLQQIGEGGFGVVYMAEQTEPVQRKVALKIIKPGMDSRQIIARFEAERQALALMDHPNIAKIFDAGVTSESGRIGAGSSPGANATGLGRPYFVMELVKGLPITKYCDEHHMTPRQRLEIFIPVCHALQHAHQKGIIHRDLKPSNVLVAEYDDKPIVKVIDFGVAKATGPKLTGRTMFTEFGQVLGTLEYMSPEQAKFNALDIDTRSDIYSLGVLLYELLTGTTPFEKRRLREAAFDEMLRIIREEEPPRPSTRLTTTEKLPSIAANRGSEPKKLSGLVRGELDWIVMKALEKDRNRRYETANGLAMDVQRYLADEPVHACPPSAGYRLRKFARKYKTLLRFAAVFVVLLTLAAVVSTWQAVRATLAERRAVAERDRAEASFRMARDAVDQLFTQVSQSPNLKARGMEKFRKDLLHSAKGFHERFIQQFDAPGVRYDLGLAHVRMAEIERELGEYAAAEDSLAKAIGVFGELVRTNPNGVEYERELGACYAGLGLVHKVAARWDKAEPAYLQALTIQEKQASTNPEREEYQYALAKTYSELAVVYQRGDKPEKAIATCRQSQDILTKLVQDHPHVSAYLSLLGTTQFNLGQVYVMRGLSEKAETATKEAKAIYEKLVDGQADAPAEYLQSLARSNAVMGVVYKDRDQIDLADALQKEALAIFEKLVKEHRDVQEYSYDVGRCYLEMGRTADRAGRLDTALERYNKTIEIMKDLTKSYPAARLTLLNVRILRAGILGALGDHVRATDEAEALAEQGDLESIQIYNIACIYSRCVAAVDRDPKLASADRARLKARHADRAVDLIRQAIVKGYRYPGVVKKDTDLDPLRGRDDFQKLVADLEAKAKE